MLIVTDKQDLWCLDVSLDIKTVVVADTYLLLMMLVFSQNEYQHSVIS